MKIKTADLSGDNLEWAVALCESYIFHGRVDAHLYYVHAHNKGGLFTPAFSSDWALGGPIVERERINFEQIPSDEVDWKAWMYPINEWNTFSGIQYGPTQLVAAMRCYVQSKLGDEIEIPDEIINA